MRNKYFTLALLVVLSFALTACTLQDLPVVGKYFGGSGSPASGPVSLTVWGLWEDRDIMEGLILKYQETHENVTITYDDRSILNPRDYKERVLTQISGSLDADVVLVHNSWVPRITANLSPMPSSLMDVNTYKSTFYPVAADSAVVGGNIYAVPFYYDGLVLVYNRDHFDEVGQQEPPTAWEEFRVLALRRRHLRYGKEKLKVLYRHAYGEALSSWKIQRVIKKHGLYFHPAQNEKLRKKRKRNQAKKRITELRREALRLVEQHTPHVVILDIAMPGMNGLEVCKRIRKDPRTERVPVLMLTARCSRSSINELVARANIIDK
ncbi:MAG: Extracellular solute-binding protein, family 1 [candidate division WWE3 bacterium GW2011_GWC1_41_7]|uniref:Extracellular solute-binding protein, family 1 n=1 Tax=candidate division WWE3 bacterium GW2011_GWC1_41_7 TaxID=1619119 RepID=A0A0G0ZEQ4_UNCKA|nr:MAG: Extracellular solute-binding protein, family 1 [candidate division WWE3 bacterium GW2011_GWC1_41_7]